LQKALGGLLFLPTLYISNVDLLHNVEQVGRRKRRISRTGTATQSPASARYLSGKRNSRQALRTARCGCCQPLALVRHQLLFVRHHVITYNE